MIKHFLSCLITIGFCVQAAEPNTKTNDAPTSMAQDRIIFLVKKNIPNSENLAAKLLTPHVRYTSNTHYGQSFTPSADVLDALSQYCSGGTALEMGAGRGENAILLRLTGIAKKVYVNDIEKKEIGLFTTLVKNALKSKQSDFIPIVKDCFQLDKIIAKQNLDLIVARNLFHFFKESQYDNFFEIVRGLLKPKGFLVLNVNCREQFLIGTDTSALSDDQIHFKNLSLIVDNTLTGHRIIDKITSPVSSEDNNPDITDYKVDTVVDFQVGNKYKSHSDAFRNLPEKLQRTLLNYIKDERQPLDYQLRYLENYSMLFSVNSLSKILEKYGFAIKVSHKLDANGFIVPEDKPANFISVIAQLF